MTRAGRLRSRRCQQWPAPDEDFRRRHEETILTTSMGNWCSHVFSPLSPGRLEDTGTALPQSSSRNLWNRLSWYFLYAFYMPRQKMDEIWWFFNCMTHIYIYIHTQYINTSFAFYGQRPYLISSFVAASASHLAQVMEYLAEPEFLARDRPVAEFFVARITWKRSQIR